MEVGRSLVSSPVQFSLGTHLKNRSSSSSSTVLLLHEQVTPALTSLSINSLTPHPPTSVLCLKEEPTFQKTLDMQLAVASSYHEESENVDPNQFEDDIQLQLLRRPELWYLLASLQKKVTAISTTLPFSNDDYSTGLEADHVVALAREAFSACKEAMLIAQDVKVLGVHIDDSSCIRTVTSTRLLERQARRRRRATKPKVEFQETNHHMNRSSSHRKLDERNDPNDPLKLFLRGPETTQLLTAPQEAQIIMKIQELSKLQEVRTRLQTEFTREPTLAEWAAAVGISSQLLKLQIRDGNISRQKLIHANFRLVVHIAKQYQGRGINLRDLLQEGSLGLMRSVEKFKPQKGCRFATYAYWWIRQAVRKMLFQHSRTIRLPENVYGLLTKVYEANKTCIQQGNQNPCRKDIAACVGISVEKLEKLLYATRVPLSMQQSVWMDQDTTFQEITADTRIEVPDVAVTKKLMRQHIRNLLTVLDPRERKIILLRFGIDGSKPKSLTEIGAVFGLSKERIRTLESRALYNLKQCLGSQGLEAYVDMLI